MQLDTQVSFSILPNIKMTIVYQQGPPRIFSNIQNTYHANDIQHVLRPILSNPVHNPEWNIERGDVLFICKFIEINLSIENLFSFSSEYETTC